MSGNSPGVSGKGSGFRGKVSLPGSLRCNNGIVGTVFAIWAWATQAPDAPIARDRVGNSFGKEDIMENPARFSIKW